MPAGYFFASTSCRQPGHSAPHPPWGGFQPRRGGQAGAGRLAPGLEWALGAASPGGASGVSVDFFGKWVDNAGPWRLHRPVAGRPEGKGGSQPSASHENVWSLGGGQRGPPEARVLLCLRDAERHTQRCLGGQGHSVRRPWPGRVAWRTSDGSCPPPSCNPGLRVWPKPQAGVGAVCVVGSRVSLSHCQNPKVWGQVGAGRDGTGPHGAGKDWGVIPVVGGLPPGDSGGTGGRCGAFLPSGLWCGRGLGWAWEAWSQGRLCTDPR